MILLNRLLPALMACLIGTAALPASSFAGEPLAIVVAPGTRPPDMDREDLAAIFGRKKRFWADGAKIDPVNLGASDARRRQFSRLVFGLAPEQMEAYWNEMYFHGVQPPFVVTSVEAVLRYVSTSPGAIGYVPLCSVDARVDLLFALDENGAPIRKPSLASCHP